ncbi:MAG: DNA (cytosine-5-)-methyltransferase [Methanosarcinales archaeon]
MKFIDLFSGIGGFRLGLQKVSPKFKCVWSCDNNKYANQIYIKNFGGENHYTDDIRKKEAEQIPDFDILCAGFPCQAFSIAGQRKGFEDTRGTLFFEIARITKAKKPKLLFLENVKGLLSAQEGYCFYKIIKTLDELGYDAEWQVLNSKHFGVPQNRERVFIIGHLRGQSSKKIFPLRENAEKVPRVFGEKVYDTNDSKPKIGQAKRRYGIKGVVLPLQNWSPLIYDRKGFDSRTKGFRESRGETPALTQKMGTGGNNVPMVANAITTDKGKNTNPKWVFEKKLGNVVSGTITQAFGRIGHSKEEIKMWEKNQKSIGQLRRLTPIECERLQGFPDRWTEGVSDTQRYKCLGNTVTVNVIETIGKEILKKVRK